MTNVGTDTPQSVDQLKRALDDGDCFVWGYWNRQLFFEFVETVGYVYTETDEHGNDPFTTAATDEQFKTALRFGGVERIDCDEIPGKEATA